MNHLEFREVLGNKGSIKYGDKVWICDYRYNDIQEKAIRHVRPQEVVVVSNTELPKNKRVYYSEFHFRPIGKNGKQLSKIIAPYDNTGYRFNTGVSLNIFLSKDECINYYLEQCEKIKEDISLEKEQVLNRFDQLTEDVNQEIREVTI